MKLKGTRCRRAGSREEIGAEQRASPVEARFDIFLADTETLRRLGRAQAFDLPQREDDAMGLRESVDRRLEHGPELGRKGLYECLQPTPGCTETLGRGGPVLRRGFQLGEVA